MTRVIAASELPINDDGSVFHLHLKAENIAQKVIMVGDPKRVDLVASKFDAGSVECDIQNREYHTITGKYKGKRVTCLSHGIGCGNIDIVMNELDALVNVNLSTREVREGERVSLEIVRVGTSGSLQDDVYIGDFVCSDVSLGLDGLLNYYDRGDVDDYELELPEVFRNWTKYDKDFAKPYAVRANDELVKRIGEGMKHGITISSPGFYGPQGRYVRGKLKQEGLMERIKSFMMKDEMRITNMEMESAPVGGIAKMLGHKAVTVCAIIAGRTSGEMNTNYRGGIEELVEMVLERI